MAEPLTSSDIWRTQRGWGVSPLASEEERKRFAAAGESPLTTQARERFETGRGISPMASKAEKEAWVAAEVMAGRRDPSQLPESYGGLGERPSATTRRGLRMQKEWDERRAAMLEEEEMARRAERERLGYELQLRQENRMQTSQDLAMESARLKEERESRVQDEAKMIFDSIRGKTLPDGTVVPPLRPNDPNALERVTNLMNMTYGMENQPAKEAVMMLYNDIIKSEESRQKESQAEEAWLVKQQEEASKLGIDTAKFIEVDPETKRMNIDQLGMAKEIGLARRKEAEDRQKQIAQSKLDEETRSQARDVLDDINKLDSEIRKENFSASRQKNSTLRQGHIDNVDFLTSEREVLVNRFNSLMPQRPQEVAAKFDSVEAAEAANLPKGTIVEINGRRARID